MLKIFIFSLFIFTLKSEVFASSLYSDSNLFHINDLASKILADSTLRKFYFIKERGVSVVLENIIINRHDSIYLDERLIEILTTTEIKKRGNIAYIEFTSIQERKGEVTIIFQYDVEGVIGEAKFTKDEKFGTYGLVDIIITER